MRRYSNRIEAAICLVWMLGDCAWRAGSHQVAMLLVGSAALAFFALVVLRTFPISPRFQPGVLAAVTDLSSFCWSLANLRWIGIDAGIDIGSPSEPFAIGLAATAYVILRQR